MENVDRELLKLMVDGAKKICDEAISKWLSGAYGTDETTRQHMLTEWKQKKEAVADLAGRLRNGMGK